MEFTEKLLEKCAEAVHKAYCNYHLRNKGVEYWTKGDYSLLDEPTKQIDRETVKAVFATIKANPLEKLAMPKIADITNITMWVDMIWSDIFDDDELPLTAAQMNIIGGYINDAKDKIRKQFSV